MSGVDARGESCEHVKCSKFYLQLTPLTSQFTYALKDFRQEFPLLKNVNNSESKHVYLHCVLGIRNKFGPSSVCRLLIPSHIRQEQFFAKNKRQEQLHKYLWLRLLLNNIVVYLLNNIVYICLLSLSLPLPLSLSPFQSWTRYVHGNR